MFYFFVLKSFIYLGVMKNFISAGINLQTGG